MKMSMHSHSEQIFSTSFVALSFSIPSWTTIPWSHWAAWTKRMLWRISWRVSTRNWLLSSNTSSKPSSTCCQETLRSSPFWLPRTVGLWQVVTPKVTSVVVCFLGFDEKRLMDVSSCKWWWYVCLWGCWLNFITKSHKIQEQGSREP